MVDTRLDMLVRLYALPPAPPVPEDVAIRPPVAYERRAVERWVDATFGDLWAGEAATALSQVPASLVIAVRDRTILGFACFDVTARGFIGPVGVDERARGRGLGVALTHAALEGLRRCGLRRHRRCRTRRFLRPAFRRYPDPRQCRPAGCGRAVGRVMPGRDEPARSRTRQARRRTRACGGKASHDV